MVRQRIRIHSPAVAFVGDVLGVVFALALLWYGLMTVLLAFKLSPHSINEVSGYRTIFNWLAALRPGDVAHEPTRATIAVAGAVSFLLFGYLAYKMIPRGHLARHDLTLAETPRGHTAVGPRVLERTAELAIIEDPAVTAVTARYGDGILNVNITVRRARNVDDTLRRARQRTADAIACHDLPPLPANVTLSGYERRQRRELQ